MARTNTIEIIIKGKDQASGPLKGITGSLSKIGKIAAGVALGGIAALGAGVGVIASQAIPAASDLEESINKVNVVFGESSDVIHQFARNASTALGQSQAQALEAAGTYGNLLTSIGLTKDQAADMSTTMVTLASDLASFNNASPEETLLALRSALTGEFEPMKRFGTALNQAAVEAKALELGLIGTKDELTPAIKAQAAYALILEQTANAQGDFARTSDGLANAQRIVKAQMQDLRATIGKFLLPVAEKFFGFLSKTAIPSLKNIIDLLATGDFTGGIFGLSEDHPFISFLLRVRELAVDFKTLISVIGEFGLESETAKLALQNMFGEGLVNTIFGIKDAITGVFEIIRMLVTGDFRGGIFGMMEDDPFITALLTFREVLLKVFDTASNFATSIDWEAIGGAIGSAFETIVGLISRIDWETLGRSITNILETVRDVVASVDWERIGSTIGEAFSRVADAVSTIDFASIGETIGEVANTVIQGFGMITDWFNQNWPQILEFITGVWEGIQEVIGSAIDVIVGEAWPTLQAAFEEIKAVLEESGVDWGVLLELLGAVAAFVGVVLVGAFLALVGIVTGVVTGIAKGLQAMAGHFAKLKETGARIIEALSQVISGFVDLVTSLVSGDWAGAWEAAKQIFSGAIDLITNLVLSIVQVFIGNFEIITKFIGGFVDGIVGFFTNLYERLIGGSIIPEMLSDIHDAFVDKFNEILDFVKSLVSRFVQVGADIIDGLKQGILNAWGGLQGLFSQLISGLPEWAKRLLGIGSPSKVFMKIGENITESLGMGVEKAIRTTQRAVGNAISGISTPMATIPATAAASSGAFGGGASTTNVGGTTIIQHFHSEGAAALGLAITRKTSRDRLNASMGR